MSDLSIISVTPNLGNEIKIQEIKQKVIERLTELKLNDAKFKNNNDVLLLVCNIVEHCVKQKKIKKKDLVLDIIQTVYSPNAGEKLLIENSIEFLHSNKAIKKLSRWYLFCVSAYEYLFKSKAKKS